MLHESGGMKLFHCRIKSSDSRQNQRITTFKVLRITHLDQWLAQSIEARVNGMEIPHPVIDQADPLDRLE